MNARFGIGDLLSEMSVAANQHKLFLAMIALLQVAAYTATDVFAPAVSTLVGGIGGFILDYAILQRLLGRWGERWRLGSMLGTQLISVLGILLGFVLLVLPGLFLLARWSLASAFVIAEEERSQEALASSWNATAQCWLPIAVLYTISIAIFGGALVLIGLEPEWVQDGVPELPFWVQAVTPNLFAVFYAIAGSLLVTAAFRLSRSETNALDNVFA